jgi:hypothetical protein
MPKLDIVKKKQLHYFEMDSSRNVRKRKFTFLAVLGIRIRMFFGLPDPDPLAEIGIQIRLRILPFSHKGVEQTELK